MERHQYTREEVINAFRAAKRRKQQWQEETNKILAEMQAKIEQAKAANYCEIDL